MGRSRLERQNLTKSLNEALILGALREGPRHGYELALDIERRGRGQFRFKHGTLYPILHKLEKEGRIRGTWSADTDPGRRRKRYELTPTGRRFLRDLLVEWDELVEGVRRMTRGEDA